MNKEKRPLKVFLCHAHSDRDKVRVLYSRLKREGVDAWLDKEKLLPGADWEYEIRKAVRESDVIVVCLSKEFNQAGFRQKEVRIALDAATHQPDGEIFIIPARLEECENLESLSKWHWVDLFEDGGYQSLIRALRARADRIGATLRIRRGGKPIVSPPMDEESEKAEQDRLAKAAREEQEREAAEKNAREKAEKDAAEKVRLEADEQASQKAAKEKADRELAEKIARDKATKDAIEKAQPVSEELARQKAKRENAERQAARKATTAKALNNFIATLKSVLAQAKPFFRIGGVIGIIIILFWGGSLAMPQLLSLMPTAKPSATITPTDTPIPPTKTLVLTATKTKMPTATPTLSSTVVPQSSILLQEDFEDGKADGWAKAGDTDYVGNWSVEQDVNGNHYWSGTGPVDYPQIWYGDSTLNWADYAFESKIQFDTEGQIFVCIRSDSGTAFYAIWLNTSEIGYVQYNPPKGFGFSSIDTTTSKRFILRKWYTIRLEIKGNVLKTYVDNVLVRSTTLTTPLVNTQGGVGYYMGGGQKFSIDDIRIWSLK